MYPTAVRKEGFEPCLGKKRRAGSGDVSERDPYLRSLLVVGALGELAEGSKQADQLSYHPRPE